MGVKPKAQTSLEYLITYGWALIIIATIIGTLVFLFSPPEATNFYTYPPTKFLVKGSSLANGTATIKLQNITGGTITLTELEVPTEYGECTIEEKTPAQIQTNPLELKPGQQAILTCTGVTDTKKTITINYKDYAGLAQTVSITGNKSGVQEGTEPVIPSSGEFDLIAGENSFDFDAAQVVGYQAPNADLWLEDIDLGSSATQVLTDSLIENQGGVNCNPSDGRTYSDGSIHYFDAEILVVCLKTAGGKYVKYYISEAQYSESPPGEKLVQFAMAPTAVAISWQQTYPVAG